MSSRPALLWFRQDLRLADNPALAAARKTGLPVIPVYVFDDSLAHPPGAAARWWLHHSLEALSAELEKLGAKLILRRGSAAEIIPGLVEETNAAHVFWNRRYFPGHIETDKKLKSELTEAGVTVETFNGALLREPWELKTGSGGPYRVFTPFWKALKQAGPARADTEANPRKLETKKAKLKSDSLKDWALLPQEPNWAEGFEPLWTPGEAGARERLRDFLNDIIQDYKDGRDRPDKDYTSRLSPHLAFGEISPLQIWRATQAKISKGDISDSAADKFLSELCWREFCYCLLFYNEGLPEAPLREEFSDYPWRDDARELAAWRKGETGYPIVDAGMRQLWRTGWMHNRVRMIVASFLIKDLLIRWQDGEAWFWDTLLDADLANNSSGWQWVAGCGADAAPYFRIFNPVTQGEKFDPDGAYVREFVPELKEMPAKHIHAPWKAPDDVLDKAGVKLGKSYPHPIVDHAAARKRALEGYEKIKRA
ncbi:cryptochrome/photolyase family protein [Hyphococcus luteus]|uniref:Deoxyribodipyrimidine photo-lyase n=1 Tax=Hyphococcus luteus TaxID=2058213 RepID=A0A2S7JYV6_9PROT|nr:deoxyribodipyrimidine photo-lyase [Marinicaulis flavus]PQA85396.1 deoxyribodipyrimidine photolyase [Marinicaulis flavus]